MKERALITSRLVRTRCFGREVESRKQIKERLWTYIKSTRSRDAKNKNRKIFRTFCENENPIPSVAAHVQMSTLNGPSMFLFLSCHPTFLLSSLTASFLSPLPNLSFIFFPLWCWHSYWTEWVGVAYKLCFGSFIFSVYYFNLTICP